MFHEDHSRRLFDKPKTQFAYTPKLLTASLGAGDRSSPHPGEVQGLVEICTPLTRLAERWASPYRKTCSKPMQSEVQQPAAEADIYLQGAHVTHWTPRGQRPVLFVSPKSLFTPGKAIRGGVPGIFPWFGARGDGKPGPAHGFARTSEWAIEETSCSTTEKWRSRSRLRLMTTTSGLGYAAFHCAFA